MKIVFLDAIQRNNGITIVNFMAKQTHSSLTLTNTSIKLRILMSTTLQVIIRVFNIVTINLFRLGVARRVTVHYL